MSVVLRRQGNTKLIETCMETVFDPRYSFGLLTVSGLDGKHPEEIGEFLELDKLSTQLGEAWADRGYPGQLSEFTFGSTIEGARKPHIDQKKGTVYNSPPRAVVLSIGRHGIGRVRGQQFPTVIQPGDAALDRDLLATMRLEAAGLDLNKMPIDFEHHESQVLIIPTLPSPVAHSVVPVSESRATDAWDCTLTV